MARVTKGGRNRHGKTPIHERHSGNQGKRNQFADQTAAETWLRAHGVKLEPSILGRTVVSAFAPVGLRVLAAVDCIKGVLVYMNRDHRVQDWQGPPRRAFLKAAA